MAKRPIPTTADMQAAIKRIDPNIPCEVIDPRDLLVAGGVSMGLWVYNGVTGGYQLTVRDKANNEWKSFDIGDNANCLEDAAKCFVDFYNAKHKSENHKFNCSMQKKKESLSHKNESLSIYNLQDVLKEKGLDASVDGSGYLYFKNGDALYVGWGGTPEYLVKFYNKDGFKKFKDVNDAADYILSNGKNETKKSEGIEDESEEVQAMIKELAEETGNNIADAEIADYAPGNGICVTFGDEEYYCYENYDDAVEASNEGIKDLLETEGVDFIHFENIGGIEKYVDTDWFDAAKRESAEFYVSDIKESEPERYKEEFGDLDEEDAVEQFLAGEEEDSIEWYINNFGKEDFNKVVIDKGLVDLDALAEAITEADGPANELAGYDGEEMELPCGYYCYRHN